jgi:hypothetical protein
MRLKSINLALLAGLILALSGSVFAQKKSGAKHTVVGTITSIDSNHVVINEKVKGKDQSMSFKLDSSTQKTGSLDNGAPVTIQYRTENSENVATSVRQRTASAAKKSK